MLINFSQYLTYVNIDRVVEVLTQLLDEVKVIRKILENNIGRINTTNLVEQGVRELGSNQKVLENNIVDKVIEEVKNIEIPYSTKVLQYVLNKIVENKEKLIEILGESTVKTIEKILQIAIEQKQHKHT